MKWGAIFLCCIGILLMFLFQWPKLKKEQKKEKISFLMLTALGWIMAICLILFPDIPGPTQIINYIFKPLGMLLE
jgi:multisubunit Na+/H+ antiporter MnhB subunit